MIMGLLINAFIMLSNYHIFSNMGGTKWGSWLRYCATSRKVAGSIPDGVIGTFHSQILPAALGPRVESTSNRNK